MFQWKPLQTLRAFFMAVVTESHKCSAVKLLLWFQTFPSGLPLIFQPSATLLIDWWPAQKSVNLSGERVQFPNAMVYILSGLEPSGRRVYRNINWVCRSENYSGLAFRSLNGRLCIAPMEQKLKQSTARSTTQTICECCITNQTWLDFVNCT